MKDECFLLYLVNGAFRATRINVLPKTVTYRGRKTSQRSEIGDVNHLQIKTTRGVVGFEFATVLTYNPEFLHSEIKSVPNAIIRQDYIYIFLDGQSSLKDVVSDQYLFPTSYVLHNNWNDLIIVLPKMILDSQIKFPLEKPQSMTWET